MGCGSSTASAPGKFNDDADMGDDGMRMRYDKKSGKAVACDVGKDDDGPEDDFFEVNEEEGEQFMSVRPWLGQIEEPENHNPVNNERPDESYALEYVYGYRCADSKQNVYFNNQGQAVYMTAALGVILDPASNTQKFFGGGEVENTAKNVAKDTNHHTDDVMAIAVNASRDTAVSGQTGSSPTIFLWDAITGEKKTRIKIAKGARGITAVDINANNDICAVDIHNDHNVYCYDQSGSCIFKDKGDQNKILDLAWDQKPGSKRFASAGIKHIYFWDAGKQGGDKTKGLYSGHEMTSHACVTADADGIFYTGGSNGSIYIWGGDDGRTCQGTIKAHKGFVSAIRWIEGKLYSGGKDGKLNVIDTNTRSIVETHDFGFIRAIDSMGGKLLVGQRDGTITLVDGGNRTNIMYSHSDGEVWGLHQKSDGSVVTSGDDNKVMVWDPASRTHKKTIKVSERKAKAKRGGASTLSKLPDSQCSRAVTCNDEWIAIAGNDGAVSIRSCSDPDTECHLLQDSREWIEVMAFSPDNQWLAVGSHDNAIYVYEVSSWSLKGKCQAHSSYIMAMDWCTHSRYIRSNCGAYELLFFTVPDCEQDPSGRSNTKAVEWATKTVKFAWDVQGIYPSGTDGTHINSVCSSADRQLFATGDDYGLVCLFRDPCIKGRPRSFRGHSEHVVRVLFGQGDSYLYSVGGYDQTLMQWKRC